MAISKNTYRGRFAPSPSGDLHFGSLVTAMASYADARHHQGDWIIRVDDIDTARIVKGSTNSILKGLEKLGFQWDEKIYFQSNNLNDYQQIITHLSENKHTYNCCCSRRQIKSSSPAGNYSGTCKNKNVQNINSALRLIVDNTKITFNDSIQGNCTYGLSQVSGDFIIRRSDQVISYLLAFVVDNYLDKVTHIIRGYDLLDSTPKQIFIQRILNLAVPLYAHIPIITNSQGIKLSKSCSAKAVEITIKPLIQAAETLGQKLDNNIEDATIEEFWKELIIHWDLKAIPKKASLYQ